MNRKIKNRRQSNEILLKEKAENILVVDDNYVLKTSVLAMNKKDKTQFLIYRLGCEDKECKNSKKATIEIKQQCLMVEKGQKDECFNQRINIFIFVRTLNYASKKMASKK